MKTYLRVVVGFQVFNVALHVLNVFLFFVWFRCTQPFIGFILLYTGFLKIHVAFVDEYHFLAFDLFYIVFFCGFGVPEGQYGSIFYILYCYYKCFGKTNVRACWGWPVFEFVLFYFVFFLISVNVTLHLFYIVFVCVFWQRIWPLLTSVKF